MQIYCEWKGYTYFRLLHAVLNLSLISECKQTLWLKTYRQPGYNTSDGSIHLRTHKLFVNGKAMVRAFASTKGKSSKF